MKIKIYDTQCGAKIFSKKVCEKIFVEKFISQWLFDVELFARLISLYGIEKTIEIKVSRPAAIRKAIADFVGSLDFEKLDIRGLA